MDYFDSEEFGMREAAAGVLQNKAISQLSRR
jgi:hypothetical protein